MYSTVLLAASACLVPAYAHPDAAARAIAPWLGTWSLNVSKSDFGTAVPQRSGTITFERADNEHFSLRIDGAEPDGKQSHADATFTPDGGTYPIEGWYPHTTIALTNLGRRIKWVIRLRGKIVDRALIDMASDRRSFTFRSQYVERAEPIYSVRVYERQ
jgi:hypothetical protein